MTLNAGEIYGYENMGYAGVSKRVAASRRNRISVASREQSMLMSMLVFLLVALPLNMMRPYTRLLYGAILAVELLFIMVSAAIPNRERLDKRITIPLVGLLAYLMIRALADPAGSVERILQALVFAATLDVFSTYEWTQSRLSALRRTLMCLMLASALYWLATGRATNYYASFYAHSNAFAVVVVAAFVVVALSSHSLLKPLPMAELLLCLFLLAVSNSRSALLSLAVLIATGLILRMQRLRGGALTARGLFLVLLAAALAFSILYPSLVGTNLGMQLDALSRTYFNKNFFSGREVVWNMVLTSVRRHELLGMGLAMTPSNIYNTVYSSHNLYLQTVLQSGIIGLALLLLLLWGILCTFATRLSNGACIGASVIACVLVHEALEVSLTQNNFTVGILFWILMGAALSVARLETGDAT